MKNNVNVKEYALNHAGETKFYNGWACTVIGYNPRYNLVIVAFHEKHGSKSEFIDDDMLLVDNPPCTHLGYAYCEKLWRL